MEGTEGEERVHDQVELSLEPTLFGDGVVVAFTGDNDGDIWLGVKRSELKVAAQDGSCTTLNGSTKWERIHTNCGMTASIVGDFQGCSLRVWR